MPLCEDFAIRPTQVFDETFEAVNRSGSESGEEDDVGQVFTEVNRWQSSHLAVSNRVDETEGDVGKAKPGEVRVACCVEGLIGESAEEVTRPIGESGNFQREKKPNGEDQTRR